MKKRHKYPYGIKIGEGEGENYYRVVIQEFIHPGKSYEIEGSEVHHGDLWKKMCGMLGQEPFAGQYVAFSNGSLPRQTSRNLRKLVLLHNRGVDSRRTDEKGRRGEKRAVVTRRGKKKRRVHT
jgi:hypothetical protein